jgi:16S rRNA (guanine(1405)-N(7))-methyltransferase
MTALPNQTSRLVDEILDQKKYQRLGIPRATVEDILQWESKPGLTEKAILKNARKKMHHLVAAYLGDINHDLAAVWLENAYAMNDKDAVRDACTKIMNLHASTRERLPHLESFYQCIFAACGKPDSILDLACGYNPFALPWMHLPASTKYHAYDIHAPRINLINDFFKYEKRPRLGEVRDILVEPPKLRADMAFFFKEAHRMEQRRKGSNRELWQALDVNYLIVSLPAGNLSGQRDLSQQMRKLVAITLTGLSWKVQEFQSGNEIIFCIQK